MIDKYGRNIQNTVKNTVYLNRMRLGEIRALHCSVNGLISMPLFQKRSAQEITIFIELRYNLQFINDIETMLQKKRREF